jgi:hypothetical protein
MSSDEASPVTHPRDERRSRQRDGRGVYLLRISEPNDVDRICAFLGRHKVSLRREAHGTLVVGVPTAKTARHERRELYGCVAMWNVLNPSNRAELTRAA